MGRTNRFGAHTHSRMLGGKVVANALRLLLLPILFRACDAHAGTVSVSEKKVGLWTIASFEDEKTKKFSHCAASITYDTGFSLIFGFSADSSWRIGWQNTAWGLTTGEKVTFVTGTNDGSLLSLNGIVREGSVIVGDLPRALEHRKAFSSARQVVLEFRGKRNVFSPDRIEDALDAGFVCGAQGAADTKTAANEPGRRQDEDRRDGATGARPSVSTHIAEAEAAGARILSSAGLSDFRRLSRDDLKSRNEATKDRWNWHAMFVRSGYAIGIRMFGPEDAAEMKDMKGRVTSGDNEVCVNANGRFLVELSNAGSVDAALRMRSLCLLPTSGWETRYVISGQPGGGGIVVTSSTVYRVDDFGVFNFRAPRRQLGEIDDMIAREVLQRR